MEAQQRWNTPVILLKDGCYLAVAWRYVHTGGQTDVTVLPLELTSCRPWLLSDSVYRRHVFAGGWNEVRLYHSKGTEIIWLCNLTSHYVTTKLTMFGSRSCTIGNYLDLNMPAQTPEYNTLNVVILRSYSTKSCSFGLWYCCLAHWFSSLNL